jgi:thiol-disulfide isomerase/thioredoxin
MGRFMQIVTGSILAAALALSPLAALAGGIGYTVPAAAESAQSPLFRPVAQYASPTPESRPVLPDIRFTDGSGAAVTLSHWRGRVVLVNLWATWCAPCIKEMPALDNLQKLMGGPGFEVLTLSQDRGGAATVKAYFARQGINNLKIYLDTDSSAGRALGTRGLPTTILVDAKGREALRVEGAHEWDSPAAQAVIKQVMAGK